MSIATTIGKPTSAGIECCFHCGEIIPDHTDIKIDINGVSRRMCCQGCRAVAQAISEYGLENYYRYRTELPARPDSALDASIPDLEIYDNPDFQKPFVREIGTELREANLIMEGIVCPACAWLNETHLAAQPGITGVAVNYTSGKALIRWNSARIRLSEILGHIHHLGYKAFPYDPVKRQELREKEKKTCLLRLGLAGLLGMQVMMIAIALYAGEWKWIDSGHRNFLRWVSFILSIPVMFYSAQPFFANSWRALRNRRIEMDVPVASGISLAWLASVWFTVTQTGTVYYDSVTMLVFFLLAGRYLEFSARNRAADHLDNLEKIIPSVVTRLERSAAGYMEQSVPVIELKKNDIVLIRPGETISVDGEIVNGITTVDESVITGEAMPVTRKPGDPVCSGSTNIDSPVEIRVTATGPDTSFSRICNLIEIAQSEKPRVTLLADRIAGWFLSCILVIAAGAAWYWWQTDKSMWLPVTIAVLVVTCPCALALATPVSITVAINSLLSRGVAVIRSNSLQAITKITYMIFDKTGTLTEGKLEISRIVPLSDVSRPEIMAIAKSLEAQSEHPVARAFRNIDNAAGAHPAADIRNSPGAGIAGTINGKKYYIGTGDFIKMNIGNGFDDGRIPAEQSVHCVFLADAGRVIAAFHFVDRIRPDINKTTAYFNDRGIRTMILSGDNPQSVSELAAVAGVHEYRARLKPADKLAVVEDLQKRGETVAVVGDGINDAPVMAKADVSIAMGSGTDLSKLNADMILPGSNLKNIIHIHATANRCMKIIRQNMAWAIAYNLLALPAAVAGLLTPWMAALGMSASSLLVIVNSLRISTTSADRPA
jgi:Cu2+-exporting ATPase